MLPPHVVNKIAAGEVVERPASVLKELLENSIDAGAGRVNVTVAEGGRRLVSVADDGCGMGRDDALLAIEPHATSKIRDVDDIEHIGTLGFRGEALAAVASVSRFRLVSRAEGDAAGVEVVVSGGRVQDVRETGCPRGTLIEVRDLFFNVPARRKFLRSHATELGRLRSAYIEQALAHPGVAMSLAVDGKDPDVLPGGADLAERIRAVFGPDMIQRLKPIESESGGVRVAGFAGIPTLARSDRSEQFVFINGRATSAPLIAHCIREAYRGIIAPDTYASLFLFVETDPAEVDVNVHPTKREVRFRQTSAVRDSVIEAIRRALSASAPPRTATAEQPKAGAVAPGLPELAITNLPQSRAFRYPRLAAFPGDPPYAGPRAGAAGHEEGPAAPADVSGDAKRHSPWSWCRVLGQVGGLYVVLETEDGLVLMDPHAAHERVLFETFMKAVDSGGADVQRLLIPETVALQPGDAERVRKSMAELNRLGFGVSEFGENTFIADALPAAFAGVGANAILVETARQLEQAGPRAGPSSGREEAIARAACKAAVRARDRLSLDEIERLVVDLAAAEMPYTCPHGRPTMVLMGFRELNRKFGRE